MLDRIDSWKSETWHFIKYLHLPHVFLCLYFHILVSYHHFIFLLFHIFSSTRLLVSNSLIFTLLTFEFLLIFIFTFIILCFVFLFDVFFFFLRLQPNTSRLQVLLLHFSLLAFSPWLVCFVFIVIVQVTVLLFWPWLIFLFSPCLCFWCIYSKGSWDLFKLWELITILRTVQLDYGSNDFMLFLAWISF